MNGGTRPEGVESGMWGGGRGGHALPRKFLKLHFGIGYILEHFQALFNIPKSVKLTK